MVAGFSLIPALGIACFRLTAWSLYSSTLGTGDPSITFISRLMQLLVMLLVVLIDRRISYTEPALIRFSGFASVALILGAVIYVSAPVDINRYIGCSIHGAASAVLLLGWGYYLCSINPRESAFSLTLAFAVFGISTWAFSSLPVSIMIVISAVVPLLSYICLRICIASGETRSAVENPLSIKAFSSTPRSIFALLFICMLISVLARLLVPMSAVQLDTNFRLYWSVLFVLIFILYALWLIVLKRKDPDTLWPVYTLVIFSGLLCYSSFSSSEPQFAAGFFRATQECLMLFCWVTVSAMVYRNKLPRVFCFTMAMLIILQPPTLVSTMITALFPSADIFGETQALIVIAVMTFVLVLATGILIWIGSFPGSRLRKQKPETEPVSSLAGIIDDLVSEFGLTKREGEIITCLAKGYDLPQTAQLLFISLNTVRTHVKNIYRKMGIHKKQQLIVIIEGRQGSLSA